jgi:CheY-like chemotaxis protein
MDGFTFVRNVRARPSYAQLPIICITGTDASDEQITAGGFAAVLRKPTTLADVMMAIDEVTASMTAQG